MKAIYTDAGPGGLSLSKVLNDQLKRACEMQKEDTLTSCMFRVCALLIVHEGKCASRTHGGDPTKWGSNFNYWLQSLKVSLTNPRFDKFKKEKK